MYGGFENDSKAGKEQHD
jgi:hypothetical protein